MKRIYRRKAALIILLIVLSLLYKGFAISGTAAAQNVKGLSGLFTNDRSHDDGIARTSGTWTRIASPPGDITNCLLLTDGRVMCQRTGTNQWYALTSDAAGSYVAGTWSSLASMQSGYNPVYFASAVLADGRVIVEGGEYNCTSVGTNCMSVWQTKGSIYNPTTNAWTAVQPPTGWTSIGDASGIVFADGTFFLSDSLTKKTAKFNAATLTWTAFGTGFQATKNDEAGWTLLPDNSVLTVDAFPANTTLSERLNTTTGVWGSAGHTPVSLVDNDSARGSDASFEIGPGILRPNGTVFYVGANPNIGTPCCSGFAHTAFFDTATSTWSAGPDVPGSNGADDAPSAILPNGNVLFQVAPPESSTNPFGSPSFFYEYDGSTITAVNAPADTDYPSYVGAMLVLPTGQILLSLQSTDVEIYTPNGVSNPSWAPTITSVPTALQSGGTYPISGTQFNGLTQGASYGDDLQAATNYPIVRITNTASGHVFFARTHDHSSMGVATGTATVSTNFDVPGGIEPGASTLAVVANGIASASVVVLVTAATPTPTNTPTNTPTATPTNTPTATPTAAPAISGIFTYGNAIGAPTPRFVSNVQVNGAGSPNVSTTTAFPDGSYSLTGFGSGSYTVTPTKTTGVNNITSFDAARIAQHVAGVNTLTGNQLIVADVSGNGSVSSFDAAEVAGYVVSTPPFGSTGTWTFSPANRPYASVTTNMTGQDYSALLMGEVSGNWTNTGARAVGSRPLQSAVEGDTGGGSGPERSAAVTAPRLVAAAENEVIIPVSVEGAVGKGIIAYEFDLRYDPAVIQPLSDPVDLTGTISDRFSVAVNAGEAGLLRVAVYGVVPISRSGVLLNLRFKAVGAPGSISPLMWERIIFNEDAVTAAADGQVELSEPITVTE